MKKKSRIPFIKTSFWLSSIVITDFYKRKKTSSVLKSYHYSHTCFFFSFSTHSVLQAVYEIEKLKNVRYWLRLGAFHKLHQHFLEGKGQKLRKKICWIEIRKCWHGVGDCQKSQKKAPKYFMDGPKSLYENYLFKFPDAFSHATDGAETTER